MTGTLTVLQEVPVVDDSCEEVNSRVFSQDAEWNSSDIGSDHVNIFLDAVLLRC